jgi:hypothetical protein
LRYARGSIRSVRGVVSSAWQLTDEGITLRVRIPVNSRAEVRVPKIGLSDVAVTENGVPVWRDSAYVEGAPGIEDATESESYVTFCLGSGTYCFKLSGVAG